MASAPLTNNIPCTIVVDSSVLLDQQFDFVGVLLHSLPKTPHTLVIPEDVLTELHGLTSSTKSAAVMQAESVLKALRRYPDFQKGGQNNNNNTNTDNSKNVNIKATTAGGSSTPNATPSSSSTAANALSNTSGRQRGVAVLQRPKETYYPIKKFARNRDTKIVACAYHFAHYHRLHDVPSATHNAGHFRTAQGKMFFVTNDVVQQLKASPYEIPTIDAAMLKRHWGHLGHLEL